MEIGKLVGVRLQELRLARWLSQRELARKVGVSACTLVRSESGDVPLRLDILLHVVEVLGVKLRDVVGVLESEWRVNHGWVADEVRAVNEKRMRLLHGLACSRAQRAAESRKQQGAAP